MIIFDLNHFEEVVTESPSIIGGGTTTVAKVLEPKTIQALKALEIPGLGKLLSTAVTTSKVSTGDSTVTKAVGKTPTGDKVKISSSSSSAEVAK